MGFNKSQPAAATHGPVQKLHWFSSQVSFVTLFARAGRRSHFFQTFPMSRQIKCPGIECRRSSCSDTLNRGLDQGLWYLGSGDNHHSVESSLPRGLFFFSYVCFLDFVLCWLWLMSVDVEVSGDAKAELSPQVSTIVTAANDCSSRAAGACYCWLELGAACALWLSKIHWVLFFL